MDSDELARLADFAERSRVDDWSLRSALCRYAQPQPVRVSSVLDLVRRGEAALRPNVKKLEKAVADPNVAALLEAIRELDALGDVVAGWAVDRNGPSPEGAIDAVVADVTARFETLGVPHEERSGPPRRRG